MLKPRKIPSKAKRLFRYDPDTGVLTWRRRPLSDFKSERHAKTWNTRYAGSIAGCKTKEGYLAVAIDKTKFLVHRIIMYLLGYCSVTLEVDHKNGVRYDNKKVNLRFSTRAENSCNRSKQVNNYSGLKRVHWDKQRYMWVSSIKIGGTGVFLGYYKDKYLAYLIYLTAAHFYFGAYAHE